MALGPGGLGRIHQIELPVGGVMDVAILDAGVVGPTLDVVARQAVVDLAEAERDTRAAQLALLR